MKKLIVILLLAMVVGIVPSLAAAISLPPGPVEFKLTDYSYLDPFDPDAPIDPVDPSGNYLIADDGVAGSFDPNLVRELRFVAAIDTIKVPGVGGAILWTPSATEELTVIGSGLVLTKLVGGPGVFPTYGYYDAGSGGTQLDFWLDTTPDFNATAGPGGFVPATVPGPYTYATVTGDAPGDLPWLTTQYVNWRDVTDPNQTALQADLYKTTVLSAINGVGGPGYLDITGGTYASQFVQGIGITPGDGTFGGLPFDLAFVAPNLHFVPQIGEPAWDTWGWTADSHDPIIGEIVPEPCTMLLLGSGLMGFAAFGRRKFKSKQS